MNKLFVSAGLVAIGAAGLQSANADSPTSPKYWNVSATLRAFYDDNYNISSSSKGSFGLELLPGVSFHMPLRQTDIGIRYTYGLYYYQDRQDLGVNAFDQSHQVDFWVDQAFNDRWRVKVTDTFAVGQEPELLNPNPVAPNPVPYRVKGDNISNHGGVALNTEWSRLFATSLGYDNSFYDYDNSGAMFDPSTGAILPQGATLAGLLDRIEQNVSLDFKWLLQRETTVFVGYQFSWVNYTGDEPISVIPVPAGLFAYHSSDRDARSHYGYVGIEQQFTPNLSAMVRVGATYTDAYNDPMFPTTSWSPYADLSVTYTYIPGSYVQLGFTHDISSTDQVIADTNGHITQYAENSVVYVDVNHRFLPNLIGTVIGRVQYSTFEGGPSGADETDYGVGVNLTYQFNPHLSVDAGYNYDNVQATSAGYSYTRNRVYVGLTANY